ncbi:MAG: NDP-sugar synthase [bacterium]
MKAMLLCAGFGERMRPITNHIPKPLLPVVDRPAAEYLLDSLQRAGVSDVIINLHHLGGVIKKHFGNKYEDINISYSEEPEILGPVGAIKKAEWFFGDEPFIVVNGDIWIDLDFGDVIKFHTQTGCVLTMVVARRGDRRELYSIGYDDDGRVRQVWGEPKSEQEKLHLGINAGVYVYEPRLLKEYVPSGVFTELVSGLLMRLFEAGEKIGAYSYGGWWDDIGTPSAYLQLHRDILLGKTPLPMQAGVRWEKGNLHNGSAVISPSARVVSPCYIGHDCVIEEGAEIGPFVVLGGGSIVGAGSHLEDVVVIGGAKVPSGTSSRHEIFIHELH